MNHLLQISFVRQADDGGGGQKAKKLEGLSLCDL